MGFGRTSSEAIPGSAPVFRQKTLDDLAAMIPAETFNDIIGRTLDMMGQAVSTLGTSALDDHGQRIEFHKMIAIAGNVGLEELSTLSRSMEARLIAGEVIEPLEMDSYLVKANQGIESIRSYIGANGG